MPNPMSARVYHELATVHSPCAPKLGVSAPARLIYSCSILFGPNETDLASLWKDLSL